MSILTHKKTPKQFVGRVTSAKSNRVYLVLGNNQGKPAWYYVEVDAIKLPLFLAKAQEEDFEVDLKKYGKILISGWGKIPPEDIIQQVEEGTLW